MQDLLEACRERVLSAAHRGVSGGNIPCNTMAAYTIAQKQGADILEIDLNKTADGKLVIFHPEMETKHLGFAGSIRELTLEQIQGVLRYVNYDRCQTEWTLCTFDEVLETFRDKCYINVDKFWDYPTEIVQAIRRHNMMDQIITKAEPSKKVIEVLEQLAPDVMFLPIYDEKLGDWHEEIKRRNVRYIGAELIFKTDESETASEKFIDLLHSEGRIAWVNALLYSYTVQLSGGHSDDVSMIKDPDLGWGWLADHGFDIIQTDWLLPMKEYLEKSGKLFHK